MIVFDVTCTRGVAGVGGLSTAWRAGAALYGALGRIDCSFGATSWSEALDWVATHESIEEVQYWGHGKWGGALVDRDWLDGSALVKGHPLRAKLEAVRERLAPDALVWFRTCETFGAAAGHAFASGLADLLGARVAGHTFVIGGLQSGLHGLRPGHTPTWSTEEGIAEGTAQKPIRAFGSAWSRPNTVLFLTGQVPQAWFG